MRGVGCKDPKAQRQSSRKNPGKDPLEATADKVCRRVFNCFPMAVGLRLGSGGFPESQKMDFDEWLVPRTPTAHCLQDQV